MGVGIGTTVHFSAPSGTEGGLDAFPWQVSVYCDEAQRLPPVLGEQPLSPASAFAKVLAAAGHRHMAPPSPSVVPASAVPASPGVAPPSLATRQATGSQVQVNFGPGQAMGSLRQTAPALPRSHQPQPRMGVQSPQEVNLRQGSATRPSPPPPHPPTPITTSDISAARFMVAKPNTAPPQAPRRLSQGMSPGTPGLRSLR